MTLGTQIIDLDTRPNMVINRDYSRILNSSGLLDFDRIYHYAGGTLVKKIKERSVIRMEIGPHDGNNVFFLKRHFDTAPDIPALIGHWLSGRSISGGMSEFENICEFRENGLPTVTPVAAGERRIGFSRFESFLITKDFAPYLSLESMIYDHPERLSGVERKQRIISAVACLARNMHIKGFNHRDFNATHVLIGPENAIEPLSLGLFDLQRIDRKKWLRFKWFIKTMAEVGYTMPAPLFSEEDRILLFKTYRRISSIRRFDRILLFWITLKIRRIERHTEKIMKLRAPRRKHKTTPF
jgi:hypothetical protein